MLSSMGLEYSVNMFGVRIQAFALDRGRLRCKLQGLLNHLVFCVILSLERV